MTQTQNKLPAPHPGKYIREELDARSWTQRDLAFVMGVPEQAVNLILAGKRGISPEMAKLLGDAFDVGAELFLTLQRAYDLSQAPQPNPDVSRRARLQSQYPVREMLKRGWLTEADGDLLEAQFVRFFRTKSVEDIPHLRHAAKKTTYDEMPAAQLAWLFRVKQMAEAQVAPAYSETALRAALPALSQLLSAPEEARQVPRILAECGVRFVVVETLPGAKIDGVCLWLGPKAPVIGISTLRDRIDNFWFVLRHEIEHVLQKHGQREGEECIDEDLEGGSKGTSLPDEEVVANTAAAEFCVPQNQLNNFIARVQPYFSEQRVVGFAQTLRVHPGLVVGQLQRRLDRWDFLKKYQVKIRSVLLPSATCDGWGFTYPIEL